MQCRRSSERPGQLLCVAIDIHEEVMDEEKMSRERAETFERLEQAQLARNQFLDNMSHELRTPLTAILGLSEALETGLYGECTQEQNDAFRTINSCGSSLLGLVNDILDVTKLETRKLELAEEPLTAVEICYSVIRLHHREAQAKNIDLKLVNLAEQIQFLGDRKRLKQALSHLVSNAVKFSPETSDVTLRFSEQAEVVVFEVLDCGPGISETELPQLLSPFRQLDEGRARHYGGLGLGLSLAYKLVALMDGALSIENREEQGACFSIRLPKKLHSAPESKKVTEVDGEGTILVVDDHEATVKLLSDALHSWGFEVTSVSSAAALKALEKTNSISAILMDGKLPDGNGIDCIRWLKSHEAYFDKPIVFLTASQGDDLKRAGLDAGASAYLEKPVRLSQLSRCLQLLLDGDKSRPLEE